MKKRVVAIVMSIVTIFSTTQPVFAYSDLPEEGNVVVEKQENLIEDERSYNEEAVVLDEEVKNLSERVTVVVDNVTFELCFEDKTAKLIDGKNCSSVYNVPSQISDNGYIYTVTEIGEAAFWGNKNLVSISIPASITTLGQCALSDTSIKTFHIPATLVYFNDLALIDISTLESVTVDEDHPTYASKDGVLYTKGYTHLITYPGARKDARYEVDSKTQVILSNALTRSKNLKELVLNTIMGVDSFGTALFQSSNVSAIIVPEGNNQLKSIDGVLYSKDGKQLLLYPPAKEDKVFFIPPTVEKTGYDGYYYTFERLQYLEELYVPASVKEFKGIAWMSTSLKKVVFASESQMKELSGTIFDECSNLESICLPKSLVTFDAESWFGNEFYNCENLKSLYLAKDAPFYTEGKWGEQSLIGCNAVVYGHGTNNKLSQMATQFSCDYVDVSEGFDSVLGVTFADTVIKIEVGTSKNVDAVVYPEITTAKTLTYTSSNTNVATVASDGTVTAHANGECIITATATDGSGEYARCKVIVGNLIEDGLHQDEDGTWYYYIDGEIAYDYTGLVLHSGVWFYVEKGVLNWNYAGLVLHEGVWFYVQNGSVAWDYAGLVLYNGVWFYVQNGSLQWGYTGLALHEGVWFYIENGSVNWTYRGLTNYNGVWFFVENGSVNWSYNSLVDWNGVWFYVSGGSVQWGYVGLVEYQGIWFYVSGGSVNWTYEGWIEWNGAWFYIKNGTIDWNHR